MSRRQVLSVIVVVTVLGWSVTWMTTATARVPVPNGEPLRVPGDEERLG
ncbi:hypothetical protein PV379_47885 [Streptomyces caniscabiei]|nr:hypothetical protein [Streptomyces caniscabiei]MDX2784971.1 hypothetical protein [Streptomyces caniscabiei]